MADWLDVLKTTLKQDEGLMLKPYQDTVDIWTVGYGHNLKNPLTEGAVNHILDDDIHECLGVVCRVYPGFPDLSDNRKVVIMSMLFNMGATALSAFKNLFAALDKQDYERAAQEMTMSKWAQQVKGRAIRLAALMVQG